jgi:hypothetical protein
MLSLFCFGPTWSYCSSDKWGLSDGNLQINKTKNHVRSPSSLKVGLAILQLQRVQGLGEATRCHGWSVEMQSQA